MHDNGTMRLFSRMSKAKRRRWIVKLIEDAIVLYILFALVWTICWQVGDIFAKMGVG